MRISPEDGDLIVSQATNKLGEVLADMIEERTREELSDSEFDQLVLALQDDGITSAIGKFVVN